MERTIIRSRFARSTQAAQTATPTVPGVPDSYSARVLKLIPAKVVSLYVSLTALTLTLPTRDVAEWLAFLTCCAATPFYLLLIAKVKSALQVILSTIAFAIWAVALGHPFETAWGLQTYGAMSLLVFTFVVPAFLRD